ncbi:MAG: hypothetical protein HY272_13190 [Gammaproteobacteria bacterium]|nr:hypothetical protein [Gammaproteobacteria bacterium]
MIAQKRKEQLERVRRTLALLEREVAHFARTRQRLFEKPVDANWVKSLEQEAAREDLAESFAAKFNRLQDTVGDKLLPRVFAWLGERPLPFIDTLQRAEKLGLVVSADNWVIARELRNRLIHEYVEDPQEFADALNLANRLADELLAAIENTKQYIENHQQ